jgi:stage II sporulation protein AA (anti-sigma F factor antagonist)
MNEHSELVEPFGMRIERRADLVLVRLLGEFDHWTSVGVQEHLDDLLLRRSRASPRRLVFDLRGVTFMDSTGIQLLLDTQKRCRAKSCEMALVPNRSGQVRELIGITRLEDVVPFDEPSVTAA